MIRVSDIARLIEQWAPPAIAWENDNVGLQVGTPRARVKGILVALDPTLKAAAEAERRGDNLLITHHPLLYRPLRSLTGSSSTEECVRFLVKRDLHVYSAHTNLDFSRGGTSFALAERLGLGQIDFLFSSYAIGKKIVTFVPPDHVETVAAAMAEAGGGRIGRYTDCSFRSRGAGTFRGDSQTKPFTGSPGSLEQVDEIRLEMMAAQWNVERIVEALRRVHPYEEVAYDVYPVETPSRDYGAGAIGLLPKQVPLRRFLSLLKKNLNLPAVRFAGNPEGAVRTVAVCGGSGAELLEHAVRKGADVFVTSDVKYHAFQSAAARIALVDAGHYETEFPVVPALAQYLKRELARGRATVPVHIMRETTNPVNYV